MLARDALGVCASIGLVAAACGSSPGSSGGASASSSTSTSSGAASKGSASSGGRGTATSKSSGASSGGGATSTSTSGSGAGGSSTGSSSTGSTSSGSSSAASALCGGSPNLDVTTLNATGGVFQAVEPWNMPVTTAAVSASSATIINWLSSNGGWGNGNEMQIDFSINILCADATTPMQTFTLTQGSCSPDCDSVTTFPVPSGGAVEGETGYACNGGGDCHLLVVDRATNQLWEMWQAFDPPASPPQFNSTGGAFVWDLTKAYPMNLRGDGCTSADAGGFPIAAMLFTADEVAAGHIDHAIRFILPNARIMDGPNYVHPATHTGNLSATTTKPDAPPYGVHLRLHSSFDVTQLPPGAQIVAKAMQTYGMFLSDGGNIALTAANDQFTTAKWADADVNVGSHDLFPIQVTDFDVVEEGALVTTGDNCIRNP
jgi:hypothetical protein